MSATFEMDYEKSLKDKEGFWAAAAEDIHWSKKWDQVLDDTNPPFYKWFVGGEMNTCYNCLDRHVDDGRGDQAALIYDSPMTGSTEKFSYSQLRDMVAKFAGALSDLGIEKVIGF